MQRIAMLIVFIVSAFAAGAVALAAEPTPSAEQTQREIDKAYGEFVKSAAEPERPHKPSGFWTGTRPAKNGAYRYRLMGVGAGVLAISIFFTVRFIRKQSRNEA